MKVLTQETGSQSCENVFIDYELKMHFHTFLRQIMYQVHRLASYP